MDADEQRTHDVQSITELRLPEIVVDEPFYLLDLAVGVSYYREGSTAMLYRVLRPRYSGKALRPTNLRRCILDCFLRLVALRQPKERGSYLEEAIELFEKAAKRSNESTKKNRL